jgi:radical SAM protein with 4Fe4S-binding SPASM domain
MVICWDGEVAICNHDWHRQVHIGNVKSQTLKSIWTGETYRKIRERHLSNDFKGLDPCDNCSHWKACYRKEYLIGELYEKDKVSHH